METIEKYSSQLYSQFHYLLQNVWNISDSNVTVMFDNLNRYANGLQGMQIYDTILQYVLPAIFTIGIIGNGMNLMVMRSKEMKNQSTSLFLFALAVSDTIILLFGLLPNWFTIVFQIDLFTQSNELCKILSHLLYSSSHISAWLIVIVTIHRYIIICKPFLSREMCIMSKAKKSIVGIVVLFLIINTHIYWTVGLDEDQETAGQRCEGEKQYKYFTNTILPVIDAGMYSVIPCLLLLILNALIVREILNPHKKMKMRTHVQRKNRKQTRFTKVLITISTAFAINAVPISILLIFVEHVNSEFYSPNGLVSAWIARATAEVLMYLNHSTSFILYSISGSKFRKALFLMVCKRK